MNETDDSNSTIPSCIVYAQKFPDPSISIYSVVPFACVYLIIFVLGVVGNLALIHVTLQHRTLQTVQNMFILNLAASDIIVCMLSLPITPVTNIYKNWFFGTVLCRLIPWVQGISVFICTFSLAAIAIDRYVLVVRPHSRPLTRRGALIVTICLWTLSVVVTLPYAVFMDVVSYDNVCGEFCTERWPNSHSRRAYTLVVLAAQFVVPFTLMAFCYWTIFSRLRDRARSRLRKMNERSQALEQSVVHGDEALALNGTATSGRSAQVTTWLEHQESERQRLLAQTRRTTSILASMVLIFGLSWLPHNVVSLIMEYDNNQMFFTFGGGPDLAYLINLFTHSIAMLNNVANPILYAWLNPTFREMVVRTFASMRSGSRAHLTSYENASLINSNSRTPRMRMTTGGGEETRAAAERAVLRAASANAAATSTPTTNGHAAKANNGNHVKDTNEAATVTPTLSTASETTNIASNPSIAAAHASTCAPTIPAPAPAPATTKPGLQTEKIAAARTASHPFDVTNFTAIPRMFDASTIVNGDTIALQQAELIRTPNFSILAQPASDKFQLYPIHDVDFLHHKIVDKTTASMPVSRRYFRAPVHQPVCRSTTELRLSNVDIFHWPNHVNAAANAAQENEF